MKEIATAEIADPIPLRLMQSERNFCLVLKVLQGIQADRDAILADPALREDEKRRAADPATGEWYRKTGIAKLEGTKQHLQSLLDNGESRFEAVFCLVVNKTPLCHSIVDTCFLARYCCVASVVFTMLGLGQVSLLAHCN